jgi:hypothetical protein
MAALYGQAEARTGVAMSMPVEVYRDQIIRAVTGNKPAIVFHVVDEAALWRLCNRLAEDERAVEILRAKGYGEPGLLLGELAALVPAKT